MQLSAASRREVIEDLLDIKIFSTMNTLIKEKIRSLKEDIRTLDLKRDSLKDKVEMQTNFINKLEKEGKQTIDTKKSTIIQLLSECEDYEINNSKIEEQVLSLSKDLEEVSGSTSKLKKLGNLKGKISQKVSTITTEHKFFTENSVCPTCTQNIDEEFRLNKISEAELKAKELRSGYEELEQAIRDEEIRESHFLRISKEITNLNHEISQNNTRVSGHQRQIRDLESEIQKITSQLENKNSEHEKLEKFKTDLSEAFDNLSEKKELISYHDFSYSFAQRWWCKN